MRRWLLLFVAAPAMALPSSASAGGNIDITGFVGERLSPSGASQPLAGASVQLLQNDVEIDSATTDVNGNYTVTAPVGPLEVVASKTNYVTQCRQVTANGSPVTPPPIELPTPAQADPLSGTVTDSFTHAPLQGVTVEVSYDQGCDPVVSIETASNGQYFFPSLPGPEHLVTFSLAGYNSETHGATVFGPFEPTVLDAVLDQVDVTSPRAKIRSVTVKRHRARVEFKGTDPPPSSGGLNFTCRLDNGTPEACESPKRYGGLSNGRHRVRVVAFDSAGNFDATPAKVGFNIG